MRRRDAESEGFGTATKCAWQQSSTAVNTHEPHRLTAILFADMVGYSIRPQRTALQCQGEMLTLAREGLEPHSGRLVKTMGDGFLAEFPTATGAVAFAIELQERVAKRNAGVEKEDRFRLRIGVHFGEVVIRGAEIEGTNVVIAARTEPLAAPGGVCLTEPVWEQVHEELPRPADRLGKLRVKGLKHPVCFYHLHAPGAGRAARWRHRAQQSLKLPGRLPMAIILAGLLMGLAPGLLRHFFPLTPEQMVELGKEQLKHFDEIGHIESALGYLTEAVRKDPKPEEAEAYLGLAYWRQYRDTQNVEKRDLADTWASRALKGLPSSVIANLVLGMVARDEKNLTRATNHLLKAHGHARSENGDVLVQLATTYQLLGDQMNAAFFYNKVRQAQSNSWSVYNSLAEYEFSFLSTTAALASATQALRLAPRSPWVWGNLGKFLLDEERDQESLACLEKSLGYRPTPDVLSAVGSHYLNQSNWLQAATNFLEAAKFRPSFYVYRGNAGLALLNIPDREAEARSHLSNALHRADLLLADTPDCLTEARTGIYWAALGGTNEACVRLQHALANCPNNTSVIASVGAAIEVFDRGGHTNEANRFQRLLDTLKTE